MRMCDCRMQVTFKYVGDVADLASASGHRGLSGSRGDESELVRGGVVSERKKFEW
jgi:hypothetical protein